MKQLLVMTLIVVNCLNAMATLYQCDAPRTHLHVDTSAQTFSFMQFCWNPCHMGSGKLIPMNLEGDHFLAILKLDSFKIDPINELKMDFTLKEDGTGILKSLDSDKSLHLTCQIRDED